MKILSIETSCDDTAIALLEASEEGFKIISNLVSSQIEIHKEWGGVYPSLAKREHQKNLVPLLKEALKKTEKEDFNFNKEKIEKILSREKDLCKELNKFFSSSKKPKVDLLAVTKGPGLDPCLWTGINFAKALSLAWNVPLVGVNHIESHILVNLLKKKIKFPAIALIASGGHTILSLVKDVGSYKILGQTKDDAAGECFDKTARVLGLEYPGGPAIEKIAKNHNLGIELPRPMINSKDYNFSFSGLKTAVLYRYKDRGRKHKEETAFHIQQAVIDVLISKTLKALKEYGAESLILGGGVTANKELRKQFKKKLKEELPKIEIFFPDPKLSTDNAVMGAVTAFFCRNNRKEVLSEPNLMLE